MTSTAAATAAIDPTALALLSIFGGVLITVIGGFIGAFIQARRDHDRWLRERRFEAFIPALALMDEIGDVTRAEAARVITSRVARRRHDALRERLRTEATAVGILGPQSVRDAMTEVNRVSTLADFDSFIEAWGKAYDAMIDTLRTR